MEGMPTIATPPARGAARQPGGSGDADLVPLYPSLREAARLIGVSASTLSRRADVVRVRAGQETRVPAADVIRLAAAYRRRPASEVAASLVARVQVCQPAVRDAYETEVDQALVMYQRPPAQPDDAEAFLAAADRLLPPELAARVRNALRQPATESGRESGVVGWDPGTD
jgi:class 3 adenylate cyclase